MPSAAQQLDHRAAPKTRHASPKAVHRPSSDVAQNAGAPVATKPGGPYRPPLGRRVQAQALRFAQWASISFFVHLLPATVLITLGAVAAGLAAAGWLVLEATSVASGTGAEVEDHQSWWYLGRLAGAALYVCALAAYVQHIRTDRRWKGAGVGRSAWLRKSWLFREGIRGYFPAHIYCDVDAPKHHRHLCFTRLDGSAASPDVDDAMDAALNMLPTHDATTGEPRRYLFCVHPHGLLTFAAWCTFLAWSRATNRLFDARGFITTVHTFAVNFSLFLWREIVLGFRFSDVAGRTMVRALGGEAAAFAKKGAATAARPTPPTAGGQPRMSVLVPGGAEESVHCTEAKLTLRKRKGFVKIAMTTGATLVPVWTFGETELYEPVTRNPRITALLIRLQKIVGIGMPPVIGRSLLNFFTPRRKPLNTVIGKPIDVRQYWRRVTPNEESASPAGLEPGDAYFTDADVDRLHADYIDALQAMYRKYQPKLDPQGPSEITLAA